MTLMQWLISTIVIIVAAMLVPGVTTTLVGAILLAVVLAIINLFIRPFIFVLTLPVNVLTLGLFSLVINALLVMLAAEVVPGFAVSGFWTALIFSVVLALINAVFGTYHRKA
ncbi:MAG TPA: phage holin family protein [Candidatus Paceibacterota bacterium]